MHSLNEQNSAVVIHCPLPPERQFAGQFLLLPRLRVSPLGRLSRVAETQVHAIVIAERLSLLCVKDLSVLSGPFFPPDGQLVLRIGVREE